MSNRAQTIHGDRWPWRPWHIRNIANELFVAATTQVCREDWLEIRIESDDERVETVNLSLQRVHQRESVGGIPVTQMLPESRLPIVTPVFTGSPRWVKLPGWHRAENSTIASCPRRAAEKTVVNDGGHPPGRRSRARAPDAGDGANRYGVHERRAIRIQLGGEASAERSGRTDLWEIVRIGGSGHRGISLSIYGDAIRDVILRAAKTVEIRQRGTVGRELGDKNVRR